MTRRGFLAAGTGVPLVLDGQDGALLFDGKTLTGWSVEEGPESSFYVEDGAIAFHSSASSPTWLRSEREYENFDLTCEFLLKGWTDSGLCFHAPRHGRISRAGLQVKIFSHDREPAPHSMGSIFPVVAPEKINIKEGWNSLRILMDWPDLRVWTNGERIQSLNVESVPGLEHRLRRGYFGITTTTYPCRFRNLRVKELPSKENWITLYRRPEDFANWEVAEGDPRVQILGSILRADGVGEIATRESFRDFELHLYARGCRQHNGGVEFRCVGTGRERRRFEIQLHDVEEAHFPTGSLYDFKRAEYPRIEPEQWFFLQLIVQGRSCVVRINGDTVLEYDRLNRVEAGRVQLQAHTRGQWLEYKDIRIKRL